MKNPARGGAARNMDRNAHTLEELEQLLERAWSKNTSADLEGWTRQNPAWGQCAVTACVVQDYCGGRLLRVNAFVPGTPEPIGHYFNDLPDETMPDLTRKQFPDGTMFSPPEERDRAYVLDAKFSTLKRYRLLKRRLREAVKRT